MERENGRGLCLLLQGQRECKRCRCRRDLPWCAIAGVGRLASPVVEIMWCVWPSPRRRVFDSSAIREFEKAAEPAGKSHDRDRGTGAWLGSGSKKLSAKHFPSPPIAGCSPGVHRTAGKQLSPTECPQLQLAALARQGMQG